MGLPMFCKFVFTVFCFLFGALFLVAEDIYISPFQLTGERGEIDSGRRETQEEINLGSLLYKGLAAAAPGHLKYSPLPKLSAASLKILNRNMVLTKLEASVVCYYENIDYLLCGKIAVDKAASSYRTSIFLYERKSNSILKQMEFRGTAPKAEDFITKLITPLSKDIQIIFTGREMTERLPPVVNDDKQLPDSTDILREDETDIKTKIQEEPDAVIKGDKTTDESKAIDEKKEHPPSIPEHRISLYAEGGLFFIMQHEWQDAISPIATADLGIKFELPIVDSRELDFSIRLGGAFSYSFANNKPSIPYISYHSLALKSSLEAYLQLNEFFSVFLGGGPLYQVDVIDFQNLSKSFFTDRASALGIQALLGVEFLINEDGTFGMGLVNSLDITLFSTTSIEYNLRIVFIFRI